MKRDVVLRDACSLKRLLFDTLAFCIVSVTYSESSAKPRLRLYDEHVFEVIGDESSRPQACYAAE